jgi:hypothetical protein
MIYALDVDTSMAKWTGCEVLAAIGTGLSLQIPMISNQASVTPRDIPAATQTLPYADSEVCIQPYPQACGEKCLVFGISALGPSTKKESPPVQEGDQNLLSRPDSPLPGWH